MRKTLVLLAITTTLFVGCKNGEKKETSSEETMKTEGANLVDSHNSETSLDWAGIYEGTIPCADCEGIKTVLKLEDDKTYTLVQTYLGKLEGENEFTKTGSFVWDETGSKVLLTAEGQTLQYKVGENQLWMLDKSGNVIEGGMANLYILKKTVE